MLGNMLLFHAPSFVMKYSLSPSLIITYISIPHRPPQRSASCLSASAVFAPVGDDKAPPTQVVEGEPPHVQVDYLQYWLNEKLHVYQRKLQRVYHHMCKWTICASGCRIKHRHCI